jgi:lambda family phage portal protein
MKRRQRSAVAKGNSRRRAPTPRRRTLSRRDRTTLARIVARYEGARWDYQRSWIPATVQSARFDATSATRNELVRKSRYFEKNNAVYNRIVDLFETYTVGAGLQMNPASNDEVWNARAKVAWDGWIPLCDLTSRQSFGTLMGLAVRTWFVDGECFILLTKGQSGRPRIQLIEGHLVGTPPELASLEGETIIDGVQIDPNGRPVAYWIATEDARGKRVFTPVRAESVVHLFEPSRPGQYRGIPFCYPVINAIHDLDDLRLLEMKAARDGAEVTNVLKNATGEFDEETLIRSAHVLANPTVEGQSVEEGRAQYLRDTVGGRSIALRTGEDFAQFEMKRPAESTFKLWRNLIEEICAGVGISYVLVFPESMQGTVYRGALDMANSFFRSRFLVPSAAAARVYEHVMNFERYANPALVDAPGTWRNVTIHPPRAVNVDVGRNSTAAINEVRAGLKTAAAWYGELGLDWSQEIEQRAVEARLIRELAKKYKVAPQEISDLIADQMPADPNAPAPADDPEAVPDPNQLALADA